MNPKIKQYNSIVCDIVDDFAKRYYKEEFDEDEYDFDCMTYQDIALGPVEINDRFFDVGFDILY